jgi:hypothetical protein
VIGARGVGIPIRPPYGPTLGRLLSPWWRASSPSTRLLVRVAAVTAVALVIGLALALLNAHFSTGGRVPFSFAYRGMYRAAPDPGGVVKIRRLDSRGRLEDSFAVSSLELPPYTGTSQGELPVFAAGYIHELERRDKDFVLYGEGKENINAVPAYDVFYTASVQGRRMFGRDVLLVAQRPGQRAGVEITILTAPTANKDVTSPLEVATTGVLLRPYKTFTLD